MPGATKTTTTYSLPGGEYAATTIQNDNVTNTREQVTTQDSTRTYESNNHLVSNPGNTSAQNSYDLTTAIAHDQSDVQFTFNNNHTETTGNMSTEYASGGGYDHTFAYSQTDHGSNLVIHDNTTHDVIHTNTYGDDLLFS